MIIRQTVVDPASGRTHIREIDLRLDDIRLPGEAQPKIRIMGFCNELSAHAEPLEQLGRILDGRRTYADPEARQTRLVKAWDGDTLEVYDAGPEGLNARPGDPLAVVAAQASYAVVVEARGNSVRVTPAGRAPAGAVAENLAGRYGRGAPPGIVTRMSLPEGISFAVTPGKGSVSFLVTPPLNTTRLAAYDVYVRDRPFVELRREWWPEVYDVSFNVDQVNVATYGGGPEAGGGALEAGREYYATVISKDKPGFLNANESPPQFIEKFFVPR